MRAVNTVSSHTDRLDVAATCINDGKITST